jgi:hypothetical protein
MLGFFKTAEKGVRVLLELDFGKLYEIELTCLFIVYGNFKLDMSEEEKNRKFKIPKDQ